MKGATFSLAVAIAAFTAAPLPAQQAGTNANAQQSTSATAAGSQVNTSDRAGANIGFGDQSASHAWEMASVNAELDGKLDSKAAKVGDRVVLKTTEKVQASDGTLIPKGSRLVGHITEVQAYDRDHGGAEIAIAFDHAELKNGQSVAIYTLIRGANPGAPPSSMNSMGGDDSMGSPMGGGGRMGGQTMGGGRSNGGVMGGAGGAVNSTGGLAGNTVGRTTNAPGDTAGDVAGGATGTLGDQTGGMVNANPNGAVQTTGHGEVDTNPSAHQAAAIRAMPRPTGFPGVMLSGNSTASGVFSASRQNIHFDTGTQIQLGISAD
jgi:hypothetical protein